MKYEGLGFDQDILLPFCHDQPYLNKMYTTFLQTRSKMAIGEWQHFSGLNWMIGTILLYLYVFILMDCNIKKFMKNTYIVGIILYLIFLGTHYLHVIFSISFPQGV